LEQDSQIRRKLRRRLFVNMVVRQATVIIRTDTLYDMTTRVSDDQSALEATANIVIRNDTVPVVDGAYTETDILLAEPNTRQQNVRFTYPRFSSYDLLIWTYLTSDLMKEI